MMRCKLCGFTASERPGSRVGSMQLHALRKHGEKDYLSLFEEISKENNSQGAEKAGATKSKKSEKPKRRWRLLRTDHPVEMEAIRRGFVEIEEVEGVEHDEWEVR